MASVILINLLSIVYIHNYEFEFDLSAIEPIIENEIKLMTN